MSSRSSVLTIFAGLACLHGVSSVSEQEHASLTLDARGALTEERRMLLRREGRERPLAEEEEDHEVAVLAQAGDTPSSCSNGGTSQPKEALDFSIPSPQRAPFTLALRVKFNGVHGGTPPQVDVPIIMWTIDKDTTPSKSQSQFYGGLDSQPPRIALKREGNAIIYEEYGTKGFNTFESDPSKLFNDGQYHDVVLVRNLTKISLWVDNEENEHINLHHGSSNPAEIYTPNNVTDLPSSHPAKIYTQNARSENGYFKRQHSKIDGFSHQDIMGGRWAFDGEVLNVRLYDEALHSHDFPDSSIACASAEQASVLQVADDVQCHGTCATCNGTTSQDCTSCAGDRALFGSECDFTCPVGYYIDESENKCEHCDSSCGGCSGSGPSVCTSCDQKDLHKGVCIDSCPDNTILNDQGECEDIVGSVVVLGHKVAESAHVLEAEDDDHCIGASDPVNSSVPWTSAQKWIVGAAGTGVVNLRNVQTGKFLDMLSPQDANEITDCGSKSLKQCVRESKQSMQNDAWAESSCSGSEFTFMSVGESLFAAIHSSPFSRFVQVEIGNEVRVERSKNDASSVSPTAASDKKRRWAVHIENASLQVEKKHAGRCTTPVSSKLACQQAAATAEITDYTDIEEVVNQPEQHPWGCHFFEEVVTPPSNEDEEYTNQPKTIQRLLFNKKEDPQDADQAIDQAGLACSADKGCLCIKAA